MCHGVHFGVQRVENGGGYARTRKMRPLWCVFCARHVGEGTCWWQGEGKLVKFKKTEINSRHTMYTHPFPFSMPLCIPFTCSAIGSMLWLHRVASVSCCEGKTGWWMRNCQKRKSTLVDASRRSRDLSPSELNKMQNFAGDPSSCTT